MKKTKAIILILIITVFAALFLTGCGKESIEGEWILVREELSDGSVMKKDDLAKMGISEKYVISGTEVKYTLEMESAKKPINISMKLEEKGDNKYTFIAANLDFAEVTLKGDTFSYYTGEGDGRMKMVFERK